VYGETVTVLTAATKPDPYSGEDVPTWSLPPASSVTVDGVAVEPRPSNEPVQDARNAIVDGFTLYLPPDVEVSARSRVVVRGGTYDVLGEPAVWRSYFTGWSPGVVLQVQRVQG
jgi:hypothetical protein